MQQSLSASELKATLLNHYGIPQDVTESFLTPKYELGDPFLFTGMKEVIARIQQAFDSGEEIGIYADYDCDGIPAAVVLLDLCKQVAQSNSSNAILGTLMERVHVYIPDRHHEGYGLSSKGIAVLHEKKVTLIITVDLGITALEQVSEAQALGIDIVVTDHHTPLMSDGVYNLPAAYGVIHPLHGEYPNKDLCGAAVAFMLVRAFSLTYGAVYNLPEGWEKWSLDLVGFATLSDMMPLTGENRTLVLYGMMVMKKTRRVGLQALFAANGIDTQRMAEQDLTFTVAPRLNAASRMATPMLAFELLATDSQRRAIALSSELTAINDMRKVLVVDIVAEAIQLLDLRETLPEIVVIGQNHWRPAVLGLVANKLQERYERSFFVWGEGGDGTLKGSCRMQAQHHAARLFQTVPEGSLLHAGGHQAAGGFAVTPAQSVLLEQALNDAQRILVDVGTEKETAVAQKTIPVSLTIVSGAHYQTVRTFAPFGMAHPEPDFLFTDLLVKSTKKFGKQKDHLECVVTDGTNEVTAFTFFATPAFIATVVAGNTISFIGHLDPGYRGGVRLRITALL